MFLGVALILVAGLTVGLLMVFSRSGPLAPPHGRGCDCGECALYLATKQAHEMKRHRRHP